jgi:tetratricopeptide (TPR) repeat protein
MPRQSLVRSVALAMFALPAIAAAEKKCEIQKFGELPVTMLGTRPVVSGTINGGPAMFLADSGAFFSMLTTDTAAKYNLSLDPMPSRLQVRGFGGQAQMHLTTVQEFGLKGLGAEPFHKVQFMVGAMPASDGQINGIIGQNVLGNADTEYDLGNGVIRLVHGKDCAGPQLAYWHGDKTVGEMSLEPITIATPHIMGVGHLNGTKIHVMFDTGSARSMVSLDAAERAGFKKDGVGVQNAGLSHGLGPRAIETWIWNFDLLDLGGEQIKNIRVLVADVDARAKADMWLGADYFLSHRIYVAANQRKVYFTFNGGRVFDLRQRNETTEGVVADASPAAAGEGPTVAPRPADPSAPQDAEGFRRRGAAFAGRRDFVSAIADFDQALKLDPNDAETFYQRGMAHWENRQPRLAMSDFNQTIALKPDHTAALLQRGTMKLANNNVAGASQDFDKIQSSASNDPALDLRIAEIYVRSGHSDDGIKRLDQWISEHPKDERLGLALNARCRSRALAGKELDVALTDCNTAMKKMPKNSQMLETRGLVLLRLGQLDKSIADYKASIDLQPKNAWSLYGLGVAQSKKGASADAEKSMSAATELQPMIAEDFKRIGLTL